MTARQERFVAEYLVDLNAARAAVRAGYSEKYAAQGGYSVLRHPEVQREIKRRREELQSRLEITQEMVLSELAKIAFASLTDFLSYRGERKKTGELGGKPVYDRTMTVETLPSAEVDGAAIQEISVGRDGAFKFKLYDKQAALEKIGRHLGMFEPGARPAAVEENNLLEAFLGAAARSVDTDEIPELL